MDTTERARLRALCEAATPGPWVTGEGAAGRFMVSTDDGVCCVGGVRRVVFEINDGCAPWRFPDGPIPEAQLIAASRTAIPALLDDLDAADVRASVAERERDVAVAVARLSRIEAIRDEARATLGAGDGVCYEGLTDAARRVVRERDEAVARYESAETAFADAQVMLRAEVARIVHQRDEARAEVERLRAELAEARLDEREACAALCETLGDAAEQERDACCDDRSRSLHAGRMHGADECARAIRARSEGGAR